MTNGDKIRQMGDEILAKRLTWTSCPYCWAYKYCHENKHNTSLMTCESIIYDWLKQEAKDE